ncbi:MAG: hypothetical protein ACXABG_14670 [Promethearchaeota archaeon]|jgi:hypothetical protein
MRYEFKLDSNGVRNSHSSTYTTLKEELKKLRKKMEITPFPFCETNCSLISVCKKIQPLECILDSLRRANQEVMVFDNGIGKIKYSWH